MCGQKINQVKDYNFNRMVTETLTKAWKFKERFEGNKEANHVSIRSKGKGVAKRLTWPSEQGCSGVGGGDRRGSQRAKRGPGHRMVWTMMVKTIALTLRQMRAPQKVLSKEVT